MKRIFLILVLFVFLTACSQENKQQDDTNTTAYLEPQESYSGPGSDNCSATNSEACAAIPGCRWQSQGGRITEHYSCCSTNVSKWTGACATNVD